MNGIKAGLLSKVISLGSETTTVCPRKIVWLAGVPSSVTITLYDPFGIPLIVSVEVTELAIPNEAQFTV